MAVGVGELIAVSVFSAGGYDSTTDGVTISLVGVSSIMGDAVSIGSEDVQLLNTIKPSRTPNTQYLISNIYYLLPSILPNNFHHSFRMCQGREAIPLI